MSNKLYIEQNERYLYPHPNEFTAFYGNLVKQILTVDCCHLNESKSDSE